MQRHQPPPPLPEIEQICAAVCDGSATRDERARLEGYLRTSADARRLYVEYINLHGALAWACANATLPELPSCGPPVLHDEFGQLLQQAAASEQHVWSATDASPSSIEDVSVQLEHAPGLRNRRRTTFASIRATSLSVASMVMLATLCVMAILSPPGRRFLQEMVPGSDSVAPDYVATLSATQDVRWAQPQLILPEQSRLRAGQDIDLAAGRVQIEFEDGVQIVVEGPSQLLLRDGGRAVMLHGKVFATVPKNVRQFVIDTPGAIITDLGTEFCVKVDSVNLSEVHVVSGRVRADLIGLDGQVVRSVELTASHAAALDSKLGTIDVADADLQQFAMSVSDNLQRMAQRTAKFRNWQAFSRDLSRDPDLVAYYTFSRPGRNYAAAQMLVNQAASTAGELDGQFSNAALNNVERVFGRWAGKGALRFAGGAEPMISVADPTGWLPTNQFTISTWVLPFQTGGPVLMRRAPGARALTCQLEVFGSAAAENPGAVRFEMGTLTASPPESLPITTSLQSGPVVQKGTRWQHVAVTYDGQMLRLFHAGRPIASKRVALPDTSEPAVAASAQLIIGGGLYDDSESEPAFIGFNGVIDEMAFLRRACAPPEIEAIFAAGQVDGPADETRL